VDKQQGGEYLELMIEKLHGYLRTDLRYGDQFLPAPFMIEFTGSPDSGKTTCIKELDKLLHRSDFRVFIPQEGAEVIRHIGRDTPEYNIRTGLYALNMLMDFAHGHMYDIVIFDRSIFDAYTWMIYWEDKKLLSATERETIQNFFLSRFWTDRLITSYIVLCEADVAVRRGQRIAASDNLGASSNPESIRKSVERHKRMYAELSPRYPQLHLVDTTHLDEKAMVEHIATTTMEALLKKARERKQGI
jgi:thymidylate kinase